MQFAADSTVLGDFNNASFDNAGVTSTFFRRGEKFMVRTDGPDGALHNYEIKFTFGVYPLQQYLVAMPRGRLQALGIAWDSRPRERGGQRWFFLYPGQTITYRDPLHWTGIDQNWNYMCADCHSTNVRKNYDSTTRTFATAYAEIDVACEACHGSGANHVAWARRQPGWEKFDRNKGLTVALDERKGNVWSIDTMSGKLRRSVPLSSEYEIQLCARCHARRGQIHEDHVHGQALDDDYRISLLDHDLYFSDGQIKSEDYEYGSFIQSRMFREGVTCSDCHDPHSLRLRAQDNNVCLQCHSAAKYDSPKHHFHKAHSPGARCVNCHMPTRTYMVVDARRDHSLRIPRPDLSVALGIPNACSSCHADKSAQWAVDCLDKWYGPTPVGFQRFAAALHAGADGAPGARRLLDSLVADSQQPAIARATAVSMLANYDPAPDDPTIRAAVVDDSPLVRRAAAQALSESDSTSLADGLGPLLRDPIRAVRIEAAYALIGKPVGSLSADIVVALAKARQEYLAAQELNADRPEAHLNLAELFVRERNLDGAEAELKTALSLDGSFAAAAVNLADLYREVGREAECEATLRAALKRSPGDASLLYALGLSMVRQKDKAKALDFLAAAANANPSDARYSYVYAVALNDSGQTATAIETLKEALQTHPYDRNMLMALAELYKQVGDQREARIYVQRLNEVSGDKSYTSSEH